MLWTWYGGREKERGSDYAGTGSSAVGYCAAPRFKVACPWLGCCKTCRRTGVTASKRHSINGAKVQGVWGVGVSVCVRCDRDPCCAVCSLCSSQVEAVRLTTKRRPRRDRRHDASGRKDCHGHAPPPRPRPIPASSTSTSNTTVASLAQHSHRRRPQGSPPRRLHAPTTSCRPPAVRAPPCPCPTTHITFPFPLTTHASCPDPDPADPHLLFRRCPCRGSAMLLFARHRMLNSKDPRAAGGTRSGTQGTLRL